MECYFSVGKVNFSLLIVKKGNLILGDMKIEWNEMMVENMDT